MIPTLKIIQQQILLGERIMKIKPFGGTIPISGPRSVTVGDGLILVGTQQVLLHLCLKEDLI